MSACCYGNAGPWGLTRLPRRSLVPRQRVRTVGTSGLAGTSPSSFPLAARLPLKRLRVIKQQTHHISFSRNCHSERTFTLLIETLPRKQQPAAAGRRHGERSLDQSRLGLLPGCEESGLVPAGEAIRSQR